MTRPSKERPAFLPIGPETRLRAYARRSYEGEDELTFSMDAQRRYITDWSTRLGAPPIEFYYNDPGGKSRADTLARPVLMQAMDDARRGEYDKLIIWKYDRFSRDQKLGSQAVFQFEAVYGVEVVSTLEPVPSGPMATMMRQLYFFVAESEWNSIVARFQGGRMERVRNGSLPSSPFSLFGLQHKNRGDGRGRGEVNALYVADYDSIDGNPDHAPARLVQRIYSMALSGGTTRGIANTLTKEGIPTPCMIYKARGVWPRRRSCSPYWHASVIGRILSNSAYRGVFEAWRWTHSIEQQRNPRSGEMEEVTRLIRRLPDDANIVRLDNSIEDVLVDDETWFAVQERLARNKREAYRNASHPEGALLRYGFATCGYCGRNIVVSFRRQVGRHYYRCSRGNSSDAFERQDCTSKGGGVFSWNCTKIDEIVWQWVIKQFEQPDFLWAKFEQWKQDQESGRVLEVDRRASLQALLEAAIEERNSAMDLSVRTRDPAMRARYLHMAEQASEQVKGYTNNLAEVEVALARTAQNDEQIEDIIVKGQNTLEQLRLADYEIKRGVLHAFDVQVKLWRHDRHNAKGEPDALEISWILDGNDRIWYRFSEDSQTWQVVNRTT